MKTFLFRNKLSFLPTLLIFLLQTRVVLSQLENTDAIIGVFLDSGLIEGERSEAEDLVRSTVSDAAAGMTLGSLKLNMVDDMEDLVLIENLTMALTMSECEALHKESMYLKEIEIIHVAITTAGCSRVRSPSTLTLPMASDESDSVQLLADLREKNTLVWKDIALITDGSLDPMNMDKVMKILSAPTDTSKQTSVTVMDMDGISNTGLGMLFNELGPRPGEPRFRQFLAIVSKNKIIELLDLARQYKLMGSKHQWLFMVPDSHSLNHSMVKFTEKMVDGDNLAFIFNKSIAAPSSPCRNGYKCYVESSLRQMAREFSNALSQEMELYNKVSEEEWEEIKPSKMDRATTGVTALRLLQEGESSCSVCTEWGLEGVEIKSPTEFQRLSVASWRPSMGLMLYDDLFLHVTGGFRKRVIAVTSLHYPPWQIFVKNAAGQVVDYKGVIFEILNELGKKLNFTYVVTPPSDNKWGAMNGGRWNGMVGMVQKKEVLMAAAAFTVSAERMTAINFTTSIDLQPYTFMIDRPKELSRVLLFIEPFANDTWILIGISVLVMGPILFIVTRLSPYYDYYGLNDGRGLFRLDNCSWYVYGAILQQGGTKLPLSNSGRLVVGFWWIYVMVVVTTYSGNLVAFLTFPTIENAVSSLDDLLATRGDMSWGYVKDTVLDEYFKTAEGKFEQIGIYAQKHDALDDPVYTQIREDNHALLDWKTSLLFAMKEQFNMTDKCDYSLGREEFYHEKVAMIIPQDSPYIDLFNAEIKKLLIGGMVEKWKLDYWPKKDKCSSTAYGGANSTRTVDLSDMQGIFILLFMGFALAQIILIIEFILRSRSKSLPSTPSSTKTLVKSFVA